MKTRVQTREQADRVHSYLCRAIESGPMSVQVEPFEPEAIGSAKRKMFVMADEIAQSLGYDRRPFRYMVQEEWGPTVKVVMRKTGEVREIAKSMQDYTRDEASAMIERLYQFVAETPEAKLKEQTPNGNWVWPTQPREEAK